MTVLKRPENLNPYIVFYSDYFGLDDEENLRLQNGVIVMRFEGKSLPFIAVKVQDDDEYWLEFSFRTATKRLRDWGRAFATIREVLKNSKDGEELFLETDGDPPNIEYLGFTFSSIEETTRTANSLLEYILFVW